MAGDDVSRYLEYLKSTGAKPEDLAEYEKYLRAQPGNAETDPASQNLFSDIDRIKIGFGDQENGKYQAYRSGLKNPHYNNEGILVGQDQNGKWVTDATNFFPSDWSPRVKVSDLDSAADYAKEVLGSAHPVNWAEANLGHALPGAGWLVGGSGGGAMAELATGNPYAAFAAASTGAGAGQTAGEAARQLIGRKLGVYHSPLGSPQSNYDLENAGIEGTASEAGGRLVGAIPLPRAIGGNVQGAISKAGSKIIAIPSWAAMLGSVPYEDAARVVERPQGVSAAAERGFGLRTAEQMEDELGSTVAEAKANIRSAQDKFRSQFGSQIPDMSNAESNALDFLERHAPNEIGDSRLSSQEHDEIAKELLRMNAGDAGTLLTQAQRMGESVPGTAYEGSVSQRGDMATNQLKSMAGDIKSSLHSLDPNGLGSADADFSQTMGKAKSLRPVEGENQEGVVNSIWGKNNTARQEAARALTPDTYEGPLLDLKSSQAFDDAGAFGATPKETAARVGIGGLLGAGTLASSHSTPEATAAIAAFLAGTSPKLNYYGLQGAGRFLQRAPGIYLQNRGPWSLLNKGDNQ